MDRDTINSVLHLAKGDISEAARNLGMLDSSFTEDTLTAYIKNDPVLNPIWGDHILQHLSQALAPKPDNTLGKDLLDKEAKYLASKGLENCGIQGNTLSKLISYSSFVNSSFDMLVNISHGMSLVNAVEMQEQAEYIKKNYLSNTKTYTVTRMIDGKETEVKVPVVSASEKLKWQKEYTSLMNTLLKFSEFATNAKLTGAKIGALSGGGPAEGSKRPKRLEPLPSTTKKSKKDKGTSLEVVEHDLK